ncbi:MAG: histidine kinase, partial [Ferruginibacter sp.]|nr:histidine kinase [Ferruginibacter sp.]
MSSKNKLYWYCQIIGWLLLFAINGLLLITLGKTEKKIWLSVSLFCVSGFIITHLMRYFIRLFDILKKNFKKATGQMILITVIFSIFLGAASECIDLIIDYVPKSMEKLNWTERILAASANSMLILLVWNCLYYTFHFIEKNRKQELDTIRLESLVKSLQLQTIKSHINPHFIFNSLNSIRALIDENPQRARTAITELSNILRSSMQVAKVETV